MIATWLSHSFRTPNSFSARASPLTPFRELTALPKPHNWFKGALLLRKGSERAGRGRKGRGRSDNANSWIRPWLWVVNTSWLSINSGVYRVYVGDFHPAALKAGRSRRVKGVCPSVCQTRGLWQKDKKSIRIFIPHERSYSVVFWEKEWSVVATPSTWNFGTDWPRCSEIADFQSIFARSASAVTPSQKSSINKRPNRKSATRFPMSLRKMIIVRCS